MSHNMMIAILLAFAKAKDSPRDLRSSRRQKLALNPPHPPRGVLSREVHPTVNLLPKSVARASLSSARSLLLRISMVSFVFFLFSGCGTSSKEEVSEHRVGEKIMIEKLAFTVNAVTRNIQLGGEFQPETDPEIEAVGVHVTVVNEGKYALSFKLEDLSLKDSKGKFYNGYPQGGPGSLLSTGRYLAMGDKISGTLIFEIPKGATGLALVYKPTKLKLKTKTYLIRL